MITGIVVLVHLLWVALVVAQGAGRLFEPLILFLNRHLTREVMDQLVFTTMATIWTLACIGGMAAMTRGVLGLVEGVLAAAMSLGPVLGVRWLIRTRFPTLWAAL